MLRFLFVFVLCAWLTVGGYAQDGGLRILMIGGHPDDCELKAGGTALMMARAGHAVKFISVTSGDAGHPSMAREALAERRKKEAQEAGKRLGVSYDVWSYHDGQLEPSRELRLKIVQAIREWKADVVFTARPYDHHPDHKYTSIAVQDAAYLVPSPLLVPETSPLLKVPVFFYFQDQIQRPFPFRPDVAVDVTDVINDKIYGLDAHESQFYEWLPHIGGYLDKVPKKKKERLAWLVTNRGGSISPEVRVVLEKSYGERGARARFAEAFELCDFGTRPSASDLKRIFPMVDRW